MLRVFNGDCPPSSCNPRAAQLHAALSSPLSMKNAVSLTSSALKCANASTLATICKKQHADTSFSNFFFPIQGICTSHRCSKSFLLVTRACRKRWSWRRQHIFPRWMVNPRVSQTRHTRTDLPHMARTSMRIMCPRGDASVSIFIRLHHGSWLSYLLGCSTLPSLTVSSQYRPPR